MQLLPGDTLGNFFNRQDRSTTSFQWVETASTSLNGPLGVHAIKAGIDLLHTGYEGTSASRPVLIRRSDGTLARQLVFDSQTTQQSVHGTDFAAFAQDRIQPRPRWWIELGGRLDYDAVTGRTDATPRVGAADSPGRHRQHRASRRHRRVLRENAARRGRVRRFRERARHAVRRRRHHAARPGRPLHARHRAEPRGRPQHGLGRGLRQAPEPQPGAAPERARPARQPRADRRAGPDGHRRRAGPEQHRRVQLPAAGGEPPRHAGHQSRHQHARTSTRPRARI